MTKSSSPSPTDESTVLDGWRQLSDDYFRDADQGHVSALSKEDVAFEAGYLSALVVIGVE